MDMHNDITYCINEQCPLKELGRDKFLDVLKAHPHDDTKTIKRLMREQCSQ